MELFFIFILISVFTPTIDFSVIQWRPLFNGGGENPVTMCPVSDYRPYASKLTNFLPRISLGSSGALTSADPEICYGLKRDVLYSQARRPYYKYRT